MCRASSNPTAAAAVPPARAGRGADTSGLPAARAAGDAGAVDVGAEGLVAADLLAAAEVLARLLLRADAAEVAAQAAGRGFVEAVLQVLEGRRFLLRGLIRA